MEIWITIKNVAGTIVGPGPITTATNWKQESRVDEAGSFSFDMPASDDKWQDIVSNGTVKCYGLVGGAVTMLGAGVVEQIDEMPGDPSMIHISGGDLLRELARYPVGDLQILEQEWTYLTGVRGSVRWIDGMGISAERDLPEAYDGDTGTYTDPVFKLGDHWWLYVGFDMPCTEARFTFEQTNGEASGTGEQYQYYSDATGWTDFSGLVDGTKVDTNILAQNGTISWTRPMDWARCTPTALAGSWFWWRIRTDKLATGSTVGDIQITEIEIYADKATTTGVELITTIANDYNASWNVVSTATTNAAYMQFNGESVLSALQTLAKSVGDHFILGSGRTITWLGPASGWSASGYRAMNNITGVGAEGGVESLLITNARRINDTAELITRIIPFSGSGAQRLDIQGTSRTAPAGYTLNKTPTFPIQPYIENDASVTTYGVVAQTHIFTDITNMSDGAVSVGLAADQLYDAGKAYLDTHCVPAYQYELSVTGIAALLTPATTIHIVCQVWNGGVKSIDINTYPSSPLLIMAVSYQVNQDGVLLASFEISNVERQPETGASVTVDTIHIVRELTRGTAQSYISGSGTGGATYLAGDDIRISASNEIVRAGNGVILYSGSGALLAEYGGDDTGLTAALAAATSGDVVALPAGTITGDVTIGAGVTLKGTGWNSVLAGMLTLGDGAIAEHLQVYQSEDTSDDIIGIIGPATGEATIRDVQVSLTQAGLGKALGLLSNGGTLRSYECEVWAHGATGSTWGVAAIAGGIVEVNQGQVRAWV